MLDVGDIVKYKIMDRNIYGVVYFDTTHLRSDPWRVRTILCEEYLTHDVFQYNSTKDMSQNWEAT